MNERRKRTIIKSITWRVTATLTTIFLVFIFTGRINTALEIGALEVVLKIVIYYIHERSWHKINWGKSKT